MRTPEAVIVVGDNVILVETDPECPPDLIYFINDYEPKEE